ncbi:MAG: septation protein SpoVG family protein [Clostridia bacterium]|nr:septation protein SpoVG family protein [Clostridia bacterium]
MEITDIKIRKILDTTKMRAIVSVTFDNSLAVHDIKVIESQDKLFLAMPSRQLPNGSFADITHPTSSTLRSELEEKVICEYLKVKNTPVV